MPSYYEAITIARVKCTPVTVEHYYVQFAILLEKEREKTYAPCKALIFKEGYRRELLPSGRIHVNAVNFLHQLIILAADLPMNPQAQL